jgi:hypothetical protein
VPNGFGLNTGIAPGDRMLAAAATVPPASNGRTRLFLLRLAPGSSRTPVPLSSARLYARTAWSPNGVWLFYQGPGVGLRALDTRRGRTYDIGFRCCQYSAMVAIRSRSP